MKTFLAVIGFVFCAFIVFFIFAGAISSPARSPSNLTEASTSSSPDSPSQSGPDFERVTIGNATYPKTVASNVAVTITKAQALPTFFNTYEIIRPETGQFVAVRVSITNLQRDEITMSMSLFKLISPDGVEYSTSEKSMEIGGDESLFLKGINPGLTKTGVVLFEVPTTVEVSSLRLKFRGGMTGEDATLPLSEVGVQMIDHSASVPSEATQSASEANPSPVSTEPVVQQVPESPSPAPIVRESPPPTTSPQLM